MSTTAVPGSEIIPEDTPNPLSTKFNLGRAILDGPAGRDFMSVEAAAGSPLAQELFTVPGVKGVYVGERFVTVSVHSGSDWWALRPIIVQTLGAFLMSGKPVFEQGSGSAEVKNQEAAPKFSAIEAGIVRVLENEIQPAVAMDGGYISFAGFENGVVKLHLRGACHSCPSSMVTLKVGIENRLKQEFPEIVAVEAV